MRMPPLSESIDHALHNWERCLPDEGGPWPFLPPSYFICHTARVGSTWLCDLLTAAGLGAPAEYLLPALMCAAPQTSGPSYIQMVAEAQGTPWGVKAELSQFLPLLRAGSFTALGRRYIYLTREDKRLQTHSLYRAVETGVWQGKPTVVDPSIEGSPEFAAAGRWIQEQETSWELVWRLLKLKPLRITYEQLVDDHEATMGRILDHLEPLSP